MVDLSGGQDGPIEHGFSNTVFILPGIIIVGLSDLLQGVKDAAKPPNYEDPSVLENLSVEKLMEILEGMDLPEEQKEEMKKTLQERGDELFSYLKMGGKDNIIPGSPSSQYFIFLIAILIIAFVFVFFGYKLIKSLLDKEKKKEEKRKQKQQKKKK